MLCQDSPFDKVTLTESLFPTVNVVTLEARKYFTDPQKVLIL